MTRERLPIQILFRSDDAFESRLYSAMKLLPRGYARRFLIRILRDFFGASATVEDMRRRMEGVVTSPSSSQEGRNAAA